MEAISVESAKIIIIIIIIIAITVITVRSLMKFNATMNSCLAAGTTLPTAKGYSYPNTSQVSLRKNNKINLLVSYQFLPVAGRLQLRSTL
jgi:hypothetical protein